MYKPFFYAKSFEDMAEAIMYDNNTSIFIGGRPICKLVFADDRDLMADSNSEPQDLTKKLVERTAVYRMGLYAANAK